MDKLAQYRQFIQDILNEYARYKPKYGDMEVIADTSRDYYQPLSVGRNDLERIHGTLIHVNIAILPEV